LNLTLENTGSHVEILPKYVFLLDSQGKYATSNSYTWTGHNGYQTTDNDFIIFPRSLYWTQMSDITIRVRLSFVSGYASNFTVLEIVAYDGHSARVYLPQPIK
jgi:hypothetical protein